MDFLQILLLSLVQGLTEYLPISSSAHLILAPALFGYDDQGLAFDVAVHVGSLLAVLVYFRTQLSTMIQQYFKSLRSGDWSHPEARLANLIMLATLPVMLAGLLFAGIIADSLRSPLVIAITTIGFGLLLLLADLRGKRRSCEYELGWRAALWIGAAQALALIPGTSRSGITMTAGLMLGMTREAAARFSFLLAIPAILMSGMLVSWELSQQQQLANWHELGWGILFSFIAAISCIHVFLRLVEKVGMWPFVVYRLLLGCFILLYLV